VLYSFYYTVGVFGQLLEFDIVDMFIENMKLAKKIVGLVMVEIIEPAEMREKIKVAAENILNKYK